MAHTLTQLFIHIIFSTKDRSPCIDPEIRQELFAYLGGIVRQLKGRAVCINGTSDHVHILLEIPSSVCLADMPRILKTNSSRWVHLKWPSRSGFAWQAGYSAFSVSRSNVPAVSRYIARQEQHHRKTGFQEELIAYLKKHNIRYDDRFLWK